jgi:hypothetical protein
MRYQLWTAVLLGGLTLFGSAHAQQVITFGFAAEPGVNAIPQSENATFCALTGVNDDADPGLCRIFFEGGQWLYTTDSDGGGHSCTAVCVWVANDESRRFAARLRRTEAAAEALQTQLDEGNARIAELEELVERLQVRLDRFRDRLSPRGRSSRP